MMNIFCPLLQDYLSNEGLSVTLCKDGETGFSLYKKEAFNLCLLDIMMPFMDGFTLAEKIRNENKSIPIIFITAKFLKQDKLKGYAIGADDYIVKPFDEEELLWKIKAILKRFNIKSTNSKINNIQIGNFEFNHNDQLLTFRNIRKRLTEKECEILNYMYTHQNKLIKREQILKDLWGENDYFLGRSLDVFITKLRKYFVNDSRLNIENVYGVGFIFHIPK